MIKLPAHAITGTGNRTRAFLTEREATALLMADGFIASGVTAALASCYCDWTLSTGAKLNRQEHGPTRARVWQVYGYHYAGTDVSSLFTVR